MPESTDFAVFKTVFFYSVLIMLLPVATFFISKLVVFDSIIRSSDTASNIYSAVLAVVVLHVALGMFIFRAYADPDKAKLDKKDDKID